MERLLFPLVSPVRSPKHLFPRSSSASYKKRVFPKMPFVFSLFVRLLRGFLLVIFPFGLRFATPRHFVKPPTEFIFFTPSSWFPPPSFKSLSSITQCKALSTRALFLPSPNWHFLFPGFFLLPRFVLPNPKVSSSGRPHPPLLGMFSLRTPPPPFFQICSSFVFRLSGHIMNCWSFHPPSLLL